MQATEVKLGVAQLQRDTLRQAYDASTQSQAATSLVQVLQRASLASNDRLRGTPEELRLASEGFLAYCGTYDLDAAKGIIVHHVTAADFPNIVGTDLVRRFVMENGHLLLETQPVLRGGKTWVSRITWAPAPPLRA